jgi:hypothetical protein
MKLHLQTGLLGLALSSGLLSASCTPQAAPPPAAPAAASDVRRFQVVVASEGDRGSVLFLVDTKEGSTWLYRPPQGPAVNGFWSDIPRITYPPDFWQRAFSQLTQQPGTPPPQSGPAAAPSGTAPTR